MSEAPNLSPATRDDLLGALSYALRFNGRKRFLGGTELLAQITAEHLIEHLERAGFVVMKKPRRDGHTTAPRQRP